MTPTYEQQQDIARNKDAAAISYLWIFSIFLLFIRKDSAFVQHHARQATLLFVLSVIFWIIPYVYLLNILVISAMAVGFITSLQGEYYRIPLIWHLLNQPAEIISFFRSLGNIIKLLLKRLKNSVSPAKKEEVLFELTKEKISEVEKEVERLRRNLHKDQEALEVVEKNLEYIKKQLP